MPRFYDLANLNSLYNEQLKNIRETRNRNYENNISGSTDSLKKSYVSNLLSFITNSPMEYDSSEDMFYHIINNIKVDGKPFRETVDLSRNTNTLDYLYSATDVLTNMLIEDKRVVDLPDLSNELKIDSFIKENQKNNFSLLHGEEFGKSFQSLSNSFKNYLRDSINPMRKQELNKALENTKEVGEKYSFVNGEGMGQISGEDTKQQYKEIQSALNISSTAKSLQIDSRTPHQPMKDYTKEKDSFAEAMNETDPTQFLLKLTNSRTPEEGLMRLNSLYVDAPVNGNREKFDKTLNRELGANGKIDNKKSMLDYFGMRHLDLFDAEKVQKATNAFYTKFKTKIDPDINIYMAETQKLEGNIETIGFKKVIDGNTIQSYYEAHPTEKAVEVGNTLDKISQNRNLRPDKSQSDEYLAFADALNNIKKGKDLSPHNKLLQSINTVLQKAGEYIYAKRGQKGIKTNQYNIDEKEILNDDINKKMVGKIFHGYGKERYQFAVDVFKEMKKLKEDITKTLNTDMSFTKDKVSTSSLEGQSRDIGTTGRALTSEKTKQKENEL